MKELEKLKVKKTQKDYSLLRKYYIMEVSVEETTVQKLIEKGTVLRYLCAEDLFDTIKGTHLVNRLREWNILPKALIERYVHISIDQMKVFLLFCEKNQQEK